MLTPIEQLDETGRWHTRDISYVSGRNPEQKLKWQLNIPKLLGKLERRFKNPM